MMFNNTLLKDLNPNQKKLVKWLEKNTNKVLNYSILQIAEENNVSSGFITKTLKKIGYYGWKDFKGFVMGNIAISPYTSDYFKYLEKTLFFSIKNSLANIDEMEISKIAKKISLKKNDLFFIGEGFSYYIALDQARRYNKVGVKSFAINSADYQLASLEKNDILIFISSSGLTESIVSSYQSLEKKGLNPYIITINPKVKYDFKNIISGNVRDSESFNERELPKHSRFVMIIILDWIWTKVQKILLKEGIDI